MPNVSSVYASAIDAACVTFSLARTSHAVDGTRRQKDSRYFVECPLVVCVFCFC